MKDLYIFFVLLGSATFTYVHSYDGIFINKCADWR